MLTLGAFLDDYFGGILFFLFCGGWVALHYGAQIIKSVSHERSRREIAAYIAEGSMTPEQGERLLRVGENKRG